MNPYQYCTRCGDELPDDLKEKYADEHQGGPVICRSCLGEIIGGISDAVEAIFNAYGKALRAAFAPVDDE